MSTGRKPQNKKTAIIEQQILIDDLSHKMHVMDGHLAAETYTRQRTEALLETERSYLHVLMEYVPDTIYFKDSQSRFLRISGEHARHFGLNDPEEAIGKTDFDFHSREFAQQTYNDEQRILATGKPLIGKIEDHGEGPARRWVSTTKIPLYNPQGQAVGIAGINRDISDLKRAEIALEEERNLMRALMDNIPDAIYFKDLESRFISVSKSAAKKFTGKDHADIIGKTDRTFFTNEHADQAMMDERHIMDTGRAIVGKEERETWPDRPDTWASTTKMPLRDNNGAIIGTFGISRDITEIMQYRDALHETKRELAQRVAERSTDLSTANARLTTRLAQLDFLTNVSYELAQYVEMEELYPAINRAFLNRFGKAAASLCIRHETGFTCVYATNKLDNEWGHACSEKALQVFANAGLAQVFIVPEWQKDEHVGQFTWPGVEKLPCYLAIPLIADNTMLGCMQIFTEASYIEEYNEEKAMLNTLSAHAAVCQSNAQRQLGLRETARVEAELDAARDIQKSFTPRFDVDIPNIKVMGAYHPAYQIGGDYLDCFQTSEGNWVLVVADVCGKGVPAALLMTHLRSTFRFEAQNHAGAKGLMCAVNRSMKANLDQMSFVTALCLVVDREGHRMTYARAGHPPLLKLGQNGEPPTPIKSNGLALGLTADDEKFSSILDEIEIPLETGDRYLVYTDGLNEAVDVNRKAYGLERLFDLLQAQSSADPKDIIDGIMNDVNTFVKDAPYHDDLTLLAVSVT